MAEFINLVVIPDTGLAYQGTVTAANPLTNQFTIPSLANLGAGKFTGATNPFFAVVTRKGTGTSGAPQGQQQIITAYNNTTGQFTTPAFTVPVAINDQIQILSADLAANPAILAAIGGIDTGLAYTGTVTLVPGADQFTIPSLAGYGAGRFADTVNPFYAVVLRKGTGTSAVPQGEQQPVTVYNTATGNFTAPGFSVPVAIGDQIQILSGDIAKSGGLTILRSAQSGDKVMTAAYVVEYTNNGTSAWVYCGGEIDLTPMQAGDTINIRIRVKGSAAGTFVVLTNTVYNNAAPVDHPLVRLPVLANQYGVEIAMIQSAGPFRTIPCEFFEAF